MGEGGLKKCPKQFRHLLWTAPYGNGFFWQCLPFSWKTLRGKHCRQPIAVMGVVDKFGLSVVRSGEGIPFRGKIKD